MIRSAHCSGWMREASNSCRHRARSAAVFLNRRVSSRGVTLHMHGKENGKGGGTALSGAADTHSIGRRRSRPTHLIATHGSEREPGNEHDRRLSRAQQGDVRSWYIDGTGSCCPSLLPRNASNAVQKPFCSSRAVSFQSWKAVTEECSPTCLLPPADDSTGLSAGP